MAKFIKGDVVVVPFPFSDLTKAKRRPALVITALEGNDLLLCQITSKTIKDNFSISLDEEDFENGSLKQPSNIRPNRILLRTPTSFYTESENLEKKRYKKLLKRLSKLFRIN